jgi:hypothetical protein
MRHGTNGREIGKRPEIEPTLRGDAPLWEGFLGAMRAWESLDWTKDRGNSDKRLSEIYSHQHEVSALAKCTCLCEDPLAPLRPS